MRTHARGKKDGRKKGEHQHQPPDQRAARPGHLDPRPTQAPPFRWNVWYYAILCKRKKKRPRPRFQLPVRLHSVGGI